MGMTGDALSLSYSLKTKDYTTCAKESDFWSPNIQTFAHAHTHASYTAKTEALYAHIVLRLNPPPYTY